MQLLNHCARWAALPSLALATSLLATSCGGGAEAETAEPADESTFVPMPTMPDEAWSATPLAGAVNVVDVRESGKDGDEVVLRGTLQDFGDLATFRLVEDSLKDCNQTGEPDHCATPWDYCCEDAGTLAEHTVNVEFLDGEFPAEWTLRDEHGLDHLTEVTVAGKLRIDEMGNLRLEATQVGPQ